MGLSLYSGRASGHKERRMERSNALLQGDGGLLAMIYVAQVEKQTT